MKRARQVKRNLYYLLDPSEHKTISLTPRDAVLAILAVRGQLVVDDV